MAVEQGTALASAVLLLGIFLARTTTKGSWVQFMCGLQPEFRVCHEKG